MAEPASHQACAQHLAALADACKVEPVAALPRGASWEIVLRFYSALHLIEGYLRSKGDAWASTDHGARKKFVKQAKELRQACDDYFDLQDMSVQVRYEPDFAPDDEDYDNARKWAKRISAIVTPMLARKLAPPPPPPPPA